MLDFKELKGLVAENSLFSGFSDSQVTSVLDLIKETRIVKDGEVLMYEGDQASELYIVRQGGFEVLKCHKKSEVNYRLALLGPGASIGEVALFDQGNRSACVKAHGDSAVLVIKIKDLNGLTGINHEIVGQMKMNLANEMSQRLRDTNQTAMRALQEKLEQTETRAEMGRFMSRVLIATCLYMFALVAMKSLAQEVLDTTLVTIPILIIYAAGLYVNIKLSKYSNDTYGLTTRNWQLAVKEAVLFSIPIAILMIFAKWIIVNNVAELQGAPVFDLYRSSPAGMGTIIVIAIAYALFAPIQEMVARSGMQSSFQMFLTGKYKTVISIFLSTLLFSSSHLHVSLLLAVSVFPLGLFWGWLYSRNPTLIGVSVSHVGLGLFGLFIVGVPIH